jgi:23S rRNA (uracil1939-C5)-methyltransferase
VSPGRARSAPPEFTAEVADLAEDGRGVARIEQKVVFIAGALPGERVRARYTRRRRSADEAVVVAVEQPAAERVEPRCPHFGLCGGCALQHLAEDAQVQRKEKQVLDALARLGRVSPDRVEAPVRGSPWGYRRRARIGVKWVTAKGRVLIGFRERDSAKLADLQRCLVLDPRLGEQLAPIAQRLAELEIREAIPQIEVAATEDVLALVLRVMRAPGEADRLRLSALEREFQVRLYLQPGGPQSIEPLNPPAPRLSYLPIPGGPDLEFAPTDFIQVNAEVSQRTVLELFSGLGNFSLPLLRAGAQLTAVEGEAGLVERARANAARHGLSGEFHCADLADAVMPAPWSGRFDQVLLDPPRTGAQAVLAAIAETRARKVLYVSCHPGTLGRDAGILVHDHGFRLTRVGVLDMFPHTGHVESMALFEAS